MADWKQILDSQLELAAPPSSEALGEIPAKRGVVLLAAEAGRPVVLLSSANLRSTVRARLTQRDESQPSRRADLGGIVRAVRWKLTFSWFETDLWYFELVRRIWPDKYEQLLCYKLAWFAHVDPDDPYPRFSAGRDVLDGPGEFLGPFASGKSAQRFIDAISDGFDLCRDYQSLRRSPHGQPCVYAEMDRCLGPCDGRISMDQYRRAVRAAADFAAGNRSERLAGLRLQMDDAAGALQYERAGRIKARLERLAVLEAQEFRHVGPAERLRFILIQRGPARTQAKTFLADRGRLAEGPVLDYPLADRQLRALAARMSAFVRPSFPTGPAQKWRIGLIGHYLYYSQARRGVIIRWREGMEASELARAIEAGADRLALRAPKPKRTKRREKSPEAAE